MPFSRTGFRCFAVLALVLFVAPALAALVSCDTCGAFNAPDVAKCAVCGSPVKRVLVSPSPKPSPIPSPSATAAPSPPTPVPSVKSVNAEPALPTLPTPEPEASEPPEATPSPSTSPTPAAEPDEPPERVERPERAEKGNLVLESEPSGASVRIRGRAAGNTPLRRMMDAGTYRVAVSLPGYETERVRLRVKGGETSRRVLTLAKERDEEGKGRHEGHPLISASPSPAVLRVPGRGPPGTLIIELVKYGEHTTASSFEVEIDGVPAGQGKLAADNLSSRLVRTYRYTRQVPSGVHSVKIDLLGMPALNKNGTLQEATREFEIQVAPERTTTLFHTWAGGIEDFARPHQCCTRGHRKP
jgi:hypothetical protein